MIRFAPYILLVLIIGWTAEALAAPPKHAPAHGWRKKHDPYYVGYSGNHWDRDYGILSGRCNREEVGTVIGGVVGGAIGSRVADEEDRAIATIMGAVAGALIGNRIGRKLDESDRSCFGHAMEIGTAGKAVTWVNDATGVRYEMVPGDRSSHDEGCREFSLRATAGDEVSDRNGVACQTAVGVWELASTNRMASRP
jgi:surface antigen